MECESASLRKGVVKCSLPAASSFRKQPEGQYFYVGSGVGKSSTPAGGPSESAYQPSTSKYKLEAHEEPSPVDSDFLTRIFTGMLQDPTAHWNSDAPDVNLISQPSHYASCAAPSSDPLCAAQESDGEEASCVLVKEESLHPAFSTEPLETLHSVPECSAEQTALVRAINEHHYLASSAAAAAAAAAVATSQPARPLSLRQKLGGMHRRADLNLTPPAPKPAATTTGCTSENGERTQESCSSGGRGSGSGCNPETGQERHLGHVGDRRLNGQLEFSFSLDSSTALEAPPKLYRCESASAGGYADVVGEFRSHAFDGFGPDLGGAVDEECGIQGEASTGVTCLAALGCTTDATTGPAAASDAWCKHAHTAVAGHGVSCDMSSGHGHKQAPPVVPKLGLSSLHQSSLKEPSREGHDVGGSSVGGGGKGGKGKTELAPQNFVFSPRIYATSVSASSTTSPMAAQNSSSSSSRHATCSCGTEVEITPRRGSSHRGPLGVPSELLRSAGNLERIVSGRCNKNGTPGLIVLEPPRAAPAHPASSADLASKRHSMRGRQSEATGGSSSSWAAGSSDGLRSRPAQLSEPMTCPPPSSQHPSSASSQCTAMYATSSRNSGSSIMLYGRVGGGEISSGLDELDGGERSSAPPMSHCMATQHSSSQVDPRLGSAECSRRQQGPHPPQAPHSSRRTPARYSRNSQPGGWSLDGSAQEHAAEASYRPARLSLMEVALAETVHTVNKPATAHYLGNKKFSKGGPSPQKAEPPPGGGTPPRFPSSRPSSRPSERHSSSRPVASGRNNSNSSRAYAAISRTGSGPPPHRDLMVDEAIRSSLASFATMPMPHSAPSSGRVYRSTTVEASVGGAHFTPARAPSPQSYEWQRSR